MDARAISLDEHEARRIEELAGRLGLSPVEVIRAALDALAAQGERRSFHHFDSGKGDGRSIADLPDHVSLSGFGE